MKSMHQNESSSHIGGKVIDQLQINNQFIFSKTPLDRSHFGGLNDHHPNTQTHSPSFNHFREISNHVVEKVINSTLGGIAGVGDGQVITDVQKQLMMKYYKLWMFICVIISLLYYKFIIMPVTVVDNLVPSIPYVFHGYKQSMTFYPSNHGYNVYACRHVQQLNDEFSIKNGPKNTRIIKINQSELQSHLQDNEIDLIANFTPYPHMNQQILNVSKQINNIELQKIEVQIEGNLINSQYDLWDASTDDQEVGNEIQLKFYDDFKTYNFTVTGFTSFYLEIIDQANQEHQQQLIMSQNCLSDVEVLQNGQKLKSNHFTCTNDYCQFTVIPKKENMELKIRLHTLKLDISNCSQIEKRTINYLWHPERNYCSYFRVNKFMDKQKIVFQPIESNMHWGISQNSYIEVYRFGKNRPIINVIVICMLHFGTFILISALIHWKLCQPPKLRPEFKSQLRSQTGLNTAKSSFVKSSFKF